MSVIRMSIELDYSTSIRHVSSAEYHVFSLLLSGSDDPEPLSTDEEHEKAARGRPFHKPESPEQERLFEKHIETLAETNNTGSDD